MSFAEFKKSEEYKEILLNDAIKAGIESTGMGDQGTSITEEGQTQAAANLEAKANAKETEEKQASTYKDPLSKIGNGGVLQYPLDLDTDIQDYFEIQIFKYRSAGNLPSLTTNNQGYTLDDAGNPTNTVKTVAGKTQTLTGSYFAGSNRRGNRQNFRLQDLQSTIQLPIPPSVKDMNAVDFAGGSMSGIGAAVISPAIERLLGQREATENAELEKGNALDQLKTKAENIFKGVGGTATGMIGELRGALNNKGFKRVTSVQAIAQAVSGLGISIDVDQAITRASGAVRNPNLELLFKGPALRNFSFTIRLTPRNLDESKRVRMIIRALKQHSAVKRNPQIFSGTNDMGSNFLLGTPDVFKLRYIKARTQKDIKGLNKFKTCALNSISVDYTGEVGRFAAYEEDSQPVTTIVSLSFTELAPIYDADYAEFTADDDVGL